MDAIRELLVNEIDAQTSRRRARVKARLDLSETLPYAFVLLRRVDWMPCAALFANRQLAKAC
jgi:hypothetical protein